MIVYFVTAAHSYTVYWYLAGWAEGLKLRVIPYEALAYLDRLPAATYVFSDLERLGGALREIAISVRRQIAAADPDASILNDPAASLGRMELLQALHARGSNRFRAIRASDPKQDLKAPVFLREENNHRGALSPLLATQRELDKAIENAKRRGVPPARLLIVEFCNTADADGVFRKYSSFMVGGRIIPRHLLHGRNWMLKVMDILDAETVIEEREYLDSNPHEPILREAFELARIDFGRIDYSLLDGVPQVWEINTNPVILQPRSSYSAGRLPSQEKFAGRLRAALEDIDRTPSGAEPVAIAVDPDLARRAIMEQWRAKVDHGPKQPEPVPRPGIAPVS